MNNCQENSSDKHKLVGTESAAVRQAVGALVVIFFTGFVLSLCFAFPILRSSDFGELGRTEKVVFVQTGKLNPNVASASELAELPSLGPAKARAIVGYCQSQAGNGKAFKNADDLENVKGIGSKTVEKIKPWLEFN
jgi:competence ComEA-like helix-hairpin-helix protein